MAYHLEGRLLEVCNCKVLCPCWIGEDSGLRHLRHDRGLAFRQGQDRGRRRRGHDDRVDRARSGNILQGNWRAAVYLSDNATPAQEEAILNVYTGKLGGPVADLVKLVGGVVSVERAPITFDVQGGKGTLKIGDAGYAELEPYQGAMGGTTTLSNTVFSTVPGAPVFVGKSPRYRSKNEKLGIDLDMKNHNALQSTFAFDA